MSEQSTIRLNPLPAESGRVRFHEVYSPEGYSYFRIAGRGTEEEISEINFNSEIQAYKTGLRTIELTEREWTPHYEAITDESDRTALMHLIAAFDHFKAAEMRTYPLTVLLARKDRATAFIGEISKRSNLRSWHRSSVRGVHHLSLMVDFETANKPVLHQNLTRKIEACPEQDPRLPIDYFEYIPCIDSSKYLKRHQSAEAVAIGTLAVQKLLESNNLSELWAKFNQ